MSKIVWSALAVSLLIGVSTATADGGGGGGGGGGDMGSMPSMSGPQYDPVAEYAKGVAAMDKADYKNAARAFQRVTSVTPKSDDAWRMLGAAQTGAANWKGAKSAYERALKISPTDAVSHAGLGVAMAKLKDAKAQVELTWLKERAATCAGTCPDAARLPGLTKDVENAINGVPAPSAMVAPSVGSADATYLAAVGLINEKRYDQALATLALASEALGPHPDILTYKGYVWRKKGDLVRARDFYEQALAVAPRHRGAMEYYGELKVVSGDKAGARQMLARLERVCAYGCPQVEELRRWIDHGGEPLQR